MKYQPDEVMQMIKKMIICCSLMVLWATGAMAGELMISFSDLTAEVGISQVLTQDDRGKAMFGLRGLHNDRKDTELVSGGLEAVGQIGTTGLEVGAGVRGYYVDADEENISAAGLGGSIKFVPPGFSQVALTGSVYYCPKVFTSLDGERLMEGSIAASYEIVPRATLFVSYTEIKAKIENLGDRTLDDTFRAGLSLRF